MVKNNRGAALVMVLLVLVVASLVGIAIMTIGLGDFSEAYHERDTMQAYYNARSALEGVIKEVSTTPSMVATLKTHSGSIKASFPNGGSADGITITSQPSGNLIIRAVGRYAGMDSSAEVELEPITMNMADLFEYGLYANLALDASSEINELSSDTTYFPIGSNVSVSVNRYGQNNQDPGPRGILDPSGVSSNWRYTETYPHVDRTVFPNYGSGNYNAGTGTISGNVTLGDINLADLTITASCEIVVDSISITDDLIISPGAYVTMFVKNTASFTKNNGGVNIAGVPEQFVLFVADETNNSDDSRPANQIVPEVFIGQNTTVKGYIFAPYADVEVQSGNDKVIGSIVCENFNGNGNISLRYNPFDSSIVVPPTIFTVGYREIQWRD